MSQHPKAHVVEFAIRNSTHLTPIKRAELLDSCMHVVEEPKSQVEINRLINQCKHLDRACRQFSFMDQSDQI